MGTLPSRMEVTVIINILLLFFLALVAQVEAQISFGSSQSSQQTAAVSRPSQSNSRPIFSQRPTSNQSGNFIVKPRNPQLESNTRHGCCFFANNICNAPCAGRLCSAQCTVQCGIFGGTCAPITCAAAAPTTCLASTATTTTTTVAPTITTATTTTVAPIVTARPVGYSQVSSSKCWQLSSTSLDWLDALTNCVQQGGTLATVDNQQEQDALSGLIPTSISSLPLTGGVWIGLSDILREGTFDTWRDDSPVKEKASSNAITHFPGNFLWVEGEPAKQRSLGCPTLCTSQARVGRCDLSKAATFHLSAACTGDGSKTAWQKSEAPAVFQGIGLRIQDPGPRTHGSGDRIHCQERRGQTRIKIKLHFDTFIVDLL